MRKFLIAGNWKMNCGPEETASLLDGIRRRCPQIPDSLQVLVCPPFVSLNAASEKIAEIDRFFLGAQNVFQEDNGAFTGEISTSMLKEAGCRYVIIGHSERREYFAETDITVNAKVKKAISDNIIPVICVGESLEQRKKDTHIRLVQKQVQAALNEVSRDDARRVVIAYEPIWAIGTGETATPGQAQQMHEIIRSTVSDLSGEEISQQVQILYGGSMKPHNAESLLEQPDVDGGLIGGASLQADSFCDIIEIAEKLA